MLCARGWVIPVLLIAAWGSRAGESIVVAGATTLQPIVQQAGMEFKKTHPEVSFVVGAGGSSKGVELTAEGKVQLGMVGREMKKEEKEKYADLAPVRVALDGICMVVSADVPLTKITKPQVQDLYTGKVKSWKELGGPDAPPVLGSRTEGHAQLELFLSYFGMESKADNDAGVTAHKAKGEAEFGGNKAKQATNNDKMLAVALENKGALVYLPIGFAHTKIEKGVGIKMLELDGFVPSAESVANGTYPFCRPLLLVTKGPAQGKIKEFIEYLLSPDGQKIVADQDYIPLQAQKKE